MDAKTIFRDARRLYRVGMCNPVAATFESSRLSNEMAAAIGRVRPLHANAEPGLRPRIEVPLLSGPRGRFHASNPRMEGGHPYRRHALRELRTNLRWRGGMELYRFKAFGMARLRMVEAAIRMGQTAEALRLAARG